MQLISLDSLKPYEKKEFKLKLINGLDVDYQPNKQRGELVVELIFVPFRESMSFKGSFDDYRRYDSGIGQLPDIDIEGAGVLSILVMGAENVEGKKHNNPYAVVIFREDKKKTKVMQHFTTQNMGKCFPSSLKANALLEECADGLFVQPGDPEKPRPTLE